MQRYSFIGGEYVVPSIPESFVTFSYSLFAYSREEAVEKFAIIFPGCTMVSVKKG
jgi:hypothetical protein